MLLHIKLNNLGKLHDGVDHVTLVLSQSLDGLGTGHLGLLNDDVAVLGDQARLVNLLVVVLNLLDHVVLEGSGLQVGGDSLRRLVVGSGLGHLLLLLLGSLGLSETLVHVVDLSLTEHNVGTANGAVDLGLVNGVDQVATLLEGDTGDALDLLEAGLLDELASLLLVLGDDLDVGALGNFRHSSCCWGKEFFTRRRFFHGRLRCVQDEI